MKLLIHTKTKGTVLEAEVLYTQVEGPNGRVAILNNHAPMILPLKENSELEFIKNEAGLSVLNNLDSAQKERINLKNGFLEVLKENNTTTVKIIAD